jgi:uncharacterized protein
MEAETEYDPRYLAGIVLFNRADYFEAHEVWEAIWMDTAGPDKKFYQGLIQAAVGLCHFCNGNVRGALKLFKSAHEYMHRYESPHLGLDITEMWRQMEHCFEELLKNQDPEIRIEPQADRLPALELSPPPANWPDPEPFLQEE